MPYCPWCQPPTDDEDRICPTCLEREVAWTWQNALYEKRKARLKDRRCALCSGPCIYPELRVHEADGADETGDGVDEGS